MTVTDACVWLKCHRVKTSSHGSGALVFCPMAINIEQVLQALGQMTEMLRLMAVNQEAQAQQTQAAAQQAQKAQPGNRRGVGLDERYFRRVEKLESHNNWKDFSFQFATAVGAADAQVKKMMDLVTSSTLSPGRAETPIGATSSKSTQTRRS